MKLTPWYPGHVKPVRVGVYAVAFKSKEQPMFSNWNGKYWGTWAWRPEAANRWKNSIGIIGELDFYWRGIAKEPK